jgi:hypothetical protein
MSKKKDPKTGARKDLIKQIIAATPQADPSKVKQAVKTAAKDAGINNRTAKIGNKKQSTFLASLKKQGTFSQNVAGTGAIAGVANQLRYDSKIATEADRNKDFLRSQNQLVNSLMGQQMDSINAQLGSIRGSGAAALGDFTSLIGGLVAGQTQEMSAMRDQFQQANNASLQAIQGFQSSIQKLLAPPPVQPDSRPAVMGFSTAQRGSMQRQRSGIQGFRGR